MSSRRAHASGDSPFRAVPPGSDWTIRPSPCRYSRVRTICFCGVTARTAAEVPKCIRIHRFRAPLGSSTSSSEIGGHPSRKGWDDRMRGSDVMGTRAATRPGFLSPSMRRRSGLRSSEHNSYYEPPGFPRQMPLRFWKKDKLEKGKPEKETEEPKEKPKAPAAAKPAPTEKAAKPEEKPAPQAVPPKPGEVEVFVNEAHAGLVDLGLTVAPTKAVFAKRVAAYPGGDAAFVTEYRSAPYKAVTRVLADWLGFRVPGTVELGAILKDGNRRRVWRVRRSGREILERLPEVRRRVRLILLLAFLGLLRGFVLRFGRLDLHRVRAAGLRAQDRHRVVQFLRPLAAFDAHAAVGTVLRVEVLLVPREEDFAVAVGAMEGPRLPHAPFREHGDPAVAELRGHPSKTKARAVMKLPTRDRGAGPAHKVKWSGFHGADVDARTAVA